MQVNRAFQSIEKTCVISKNIWQLNMGKAHSSEWSILQQDLGNKHSYSKFAVGLVFPSVSSIALHGNKDIYTPKWHSLKQCDCDEVVGLSTSFNKMEIQMVRMCVGKLREFVKPWVMRPCSYLISEYLELYRIWHLLWGRFQDSLVTHRDCGFFISGCWMTFELSNKMSIPRFVWVNKIKEIFIWFDLFKSEKKYS